jgi:hypothetical protein
MRCNKISYIHTSNNDPLWTEAIPWPYNDWLKEGHLTQVAVGFPMFKYLHPCNDWLKEGHLTQVAVGFPVFKSLHPCMAINSFDLLRVKPWIQ